jgi:hypothetical protein
MQIFVSFPEREKLLNQVTAANTLLSFVKVFNSRLKAAYLLNSLSILAIRMLPERSDICFASAQAKVCSC